MHLTETVLLLLCLTSAADSVTRTTNQFCTIQFCWGFNYFDLPKYYGGLFKTRDQILQESFRWAVSRQRRYGRTLFRFWGIIFRTSYEFGNDFDICCPTTHSHINPTTLTNINGETRIIIHFDQLQPPQYQWIPNAECSSAPHFCNGVCRIENISMYLLVADFTKNPPFEFDTFSIPGYCSCKSS